MGLMTIPYVTGKLHGELIHSTYSTYWLDLAGMCWGGRRSWWSTGWSHWKRLWSFFHIAEVPHSTWGNPVLDFWGSSTNCQKKHNLYSYAIYIYIWFLHSIYTHQIQTNLHHSRDVPGTSPTWTSYLQRPGSLPSGPEAPDVVRLVHRFFIQRKKLPPALGRIYGKYDR